MTGKIECESPICVWIALSICRLICSIKWKPPDEISIDVRIERVPLPVEEIQDSSGVEYSLYTWSGGDRYEYFDRLIVNPHQSEG
jgi:hypothetical protein